VYGGRLAVKHDRVGGPLPLANSVAFSAGPSLSPVKVASYFCSELSITAK
jgi:hypothetical protein